MNVAHSRTSRARYFAIGLLFIMGIVYVAPALRPGWVLAPIDIAADCEAWKPSESQRVRVANSLLSDVLVQFVVWDVEVKRLLSHGELPWRNVYAGDGQPLFANPQVALFSPFTWPRLGLGLQGWVASAYLKLIAAMLGMYCFARGEKSSRISASLSAAIYAYSGYMICYLLYPLTNVFAILPLFAAACCNLARARSVKTASGVALTAFLMTAGGHPETLMVGVIGVFLYVFLEARRERRGLRDLIPVAVFAPLGFAADAMQLIPFSHLLLDSSARVARPLMARPFRIWAAAGTVLPGVLGSPLRGELDLTAIASGDNFSMRASAYVGAIVLLCIAVAFSRLRPAMRTAVWIAGGALLLSLNVPVVAAVAGHVPLFALVAPQYYGVAFTLFASLAGGRAISVASRRRRLRTSVVLAVLGASMIVAGLVPSLPFARPKITSAAERGIAALKARGHLHQPDAVYRERLAYYLVSGAATALRRVALPGLCFAIAAAGFASSSRSRARFLLGAAAIGELLLFGVGFNPAVALSDAPVSPPAVLALLRAPDHSRYLLAASFDVFPANLSTLYGLRDLTSYDAMDSARRVRALAAAGYDSFLHTIPARPTPAQLNELRRLGVAFLLTRDAPPDSIRIGGDPSPAVGAYRLKGTIADVTMPANSPPDGLVAGAVTSLCALLLLAVLLYRMPSQKTNPARIHSIAM